MIVTLTTDFGVEDGYVGTMKGVILGIAQEAALVDITHAIVPQDVRQAAYILWTCLPYFPQDSVHLVVVDPGVGTARRPIASQTAWGMLVGPDNGVFSYVWEVAPPEMTVVLAERRYQRQVVSSTFHGRDIFAPAAAHLARGVPLKDLGPVVDDPVRLPTPHLDIGTDRIVGEILHVDRFGNAISNIGRLIWEGEILHLDPAFGGQPARLLNARRFHVRVAGRDLGPVRHTYGEVAVGSPLALVGSEGMLELAVNQGHGADILNVHVGDTVELVAKG